MTSTCKPQLALSHVHENEVHVWNCNLHDAPSMEHGAFLSADEIERSSKFRTRRDADRFMAARSSLRFILSRYLKTAPDLLHFALGSFGKPYLPGKPIHFNLSHTADMTLIALAQREVGIDIEQFNPSVDVAEIARAYFSGEEYQYLESRSITERQQKFFELWTRKEALFKAQGLGVAQGFESAGPITSEWSVIQLEASENYFAALAIQGPHQPVCRMWDIRALS